MIEIQVLSIIVFGIQILSFLLKIHKQEIKKLTN